MVAVLTAGSLPAKLKEEMLNFQTQRWNRVLISLLLALSCVFHSPRANADGQDRKTLVLLALYGAAVGTIAGLATAPLTRDWRTILVGTSVGLYLGGAVGVYHIYNRYDPGNPLNPENQGFNQNGFVPFSSVSVKYAAPRPVIAFSFPVIQF